MVLNAQTYLWMGWDGSLKVPIIYEHLTQCPARVGFGQSRSEKWRKNAIHSFREVQVKKMTWDRDREMKVKWKWLEIEIVKWKWNEKASRSRCEISREFSGIFDISKFIPDVFCFGFCTLLECLIFLWNSVSNFTLFLVKKCEIFFPITLFEKWMWNKNDWKSRSRSEIKMTRDREVKFQKNSREFPRGETLAGH